MCVQQTFDKTTKELGVIGAVAAVSKGGQLVWQGVSGISDKDTQQPMKSDARFLIYSLTKTYIACAILRLVQEQILSLDDPVNRWLGTDLSIQIRQLLNHTGGLPDYGTLDLYQSELRAHPSHAWSDEQFLMYTLKQGMKQEWAYSNIGYLFLRRIIETATKKSLKEAMKDLLFESLQLSDTSVISTTSEMKMLTPGYSSFWNKDGAFQDARSIYDPNWCAPGVIASTVKDVVKFYDEVLEAGFIEPQMQHEMTTFMRVPYKHPFHNFPSYGFGLMADPASEYGLMLGHNGEGPGYSASCFHFPKSKVTLAVLCNSENVAEKILYRLIETVMDIHS